MVKPATKKILIATVGGALEPVVASIQHHQPDHVYFICSCLPDGVLAPPDDVAAALERQPQMPVPTNAFVDGHTRATSEKGNIVERAGLAPGCYDKVEIPLDKIDDVQTCYAAVLQTFGRALDSRGEVQVIADYTGGTKSMTSALVRAGTGRYAQDCRLSVVTGLRDGAGTVRTGTEQVFLHEALPITLEDQWDEALRLFNEHHYSSAGAILHTLTHILQSTPVPRLERKTRALGSLSNFFDHWDQFLFAEAMRIDRSPIEGISRLHKLLAPLLGQLQTLGQGFPTTWNATSLLPVEDMLHNAARRAQQGRFDDAIIRLYRTVEMLAQARLYCAHGIDANDIDRTKVPATWLTHRQRPQTGKLWTDGLEDTYDLLWRLKSGKDRDRLALLYRESAWAIKTLAPLRNKSILVHGTQPLSKDTFEAAEKIVQGFLGEARRKTGVPPQSLLEPFPQFHASLFE